MKISLGYKFFCASKANLVPDILLNSIWLEYNFYRVWESSWIFCCRLSCCIPFLLIGVGVKLSINCMVFWGTCKRTFDGLGILSLSKVTWVRECEFFNYFFYPIEDFSLWQVFFILLWKLIIDFHLFYWKFWWSFQQPLNNTRVFEHNLIRLLFP